MTISQTLDIEVGVRGDVAEPVDGAPVDLGMAVLHLMAELPCRVGECLEPAEYGVLHLLLLEEGRAVLAA